MPDLEKFIESLWILDSHEHIAPEEERLRQKADLFQIFAAYLISSDLIAAGFSFEDYVKLMDANIPIIERWKMVEPYWNKSCNTVYFDSIKIAAKDLYGIDEINERTIPELVDKINSSNKKGLYRWVLKDRARITLSIHDSLIDNVNVDREFFVPVVRLEDFIVIRSRNDVKRISKMLNMPIHSLREFEKALELKVKSLIDKIAGFKIALAYKRNLSFEKVTFNEAEQVFNRIMGSKETFWAKDIPIRPDMIRIAIPDEISVKEGKDLQDYIVHKILQLAAKYSMPVQIHTGLQIDNLNTIRNSDPLRLTNLFMEYSDVTFDIFHGSYPYTKELATLAKTFPNVYIDMCWLHVLSPHTAREALSDWLDLVPANKIIGFGGDYEYVEGVYSHAKIARRNITKVLRSKIEEERFNESEAKKIAQMILRDNLLEVFKKVKG